MAVELCRENLSDKAPRVIRNYLKDIGVTDRETVQTTINRILLGVKHPVERNRTELSDSILQSIINTGAKEGIHLRINGHQMNDLGRWLANDFLGSIANL